MAPGSLALCIFDEVSLNLTEFIPPTICGFLVDHRGTEGHCLYSLAQWPVVPVQALLSAYSLVAPPECQVLSWAAIYMETDNLHTAVLSCTQLSVPLALPPFSRFPVSTDLGIYLGLLKSMRGEASVFSAATACMFPLPSSGSENLPDTQEIHSFLLPGSLHKMNLSFLWLF